MKRNFLEKGYYHIFNRGALKQTLFLDEKDYIRFLFLILSSQGDFSIPKTARQLGQYSVLGIM
jgi:hypothetical protein